MAQYHLEFRLILILMMISLSQQRECGQTLASGSAIRSHVATSGDSMGRIIDWPWMVKIEKLEGRKYVHHCGGSLLNKNHVMTAAHCLENIDKKDLRLLLGTDDIQDTAEGQPFQKVRKAERTYLHPKYSSTLVYFDVAIIKLSEEVVFSAGIQPICLPETPDEDVDSRKYYAATLTGWGTTSRDVSSTTSKLRFTRLTIFPQAFCNQSYNVGGRLGASIKVSMPQLFEDNIFCAGFEAGGEGSCFGDSGGPLVVYDAIENHHLQVGVVRGTSGECGDRSFPDIYSRLENLEILRWIYRLALGKRLRRNPSRNQPAAQPLKNPTTSALSSTPHTQSGYILLAGGVDVLFDYTSAKVEVLDKSGNLSALVDLPHKTKWATGGLLENYPIICGGTNHPTVHDKCFRLMQDGSRWVLFSVMKEKRAGASTTVLHSKLWISGGFNQSSTEFLTVDGHVSHGPSLPEELSGHATIKVDEQIFLIGGHNGKERTRTTRIYNADLTTFASRCCLWKTGPLLNNGRSFHGITSVASNNHQGRNVIIVAGGSGAAASVELWDHTKTGSRWTEINDLPVNMIARPGLHPDGHEVTIVYRGAAYRLMMENGEYVYQRLNIQARLPRDAVVSVAIPDEVVNKWT